MTLNQEGASGVRYIAKIIEDGRQLFSDPFDTIDEAKRAGRRMFMTNRFDILEISDDGTGVYEGIRYIAA